MEIMLQENDNRIRKRSDASNTTKQCVFKDSVTMRKERSL